MAGGVFETLKQAKMKYETLLSGKKTMTTPVNEARSYDRNKALRYTNKCISK